jgi:hypothetical protein
MKTIDEIGLDVAFLPKNITGELQVPDLVVNGPLKANIRKNRACVLYNSFQDYKVDRAEDSIVCYLWSSGKTWILIDRNQL